MLQSIIAAVISSQIDLAEQEEEEQVRHANDDFINDSDNSDEDDSDNQLESDQEDDSDEELNADDAEESKQVGESDFGFVAPRGKKKNAGGEDSFDNEDDDESTTLNVSFGFLHFVCVFSSTCK